MINHPRTMRNMVIFCSSLSFVGLWVSQGVPLLSVVARVWRRGVLGSCQAGRTNSPPHGLSGPGRRAWACSDVCDRFQKGSGTCARLPEAKLGTGAGSPLPHSFGQSKSPGQPTFKARDNRCPLLNDRSCRGTLPRAWSQRPPVHSVCCTQDKTDPRGTKGSCTIPDR